MNYEYDVEIDILAMLKYLAKKWKVIVLAGIACCLLFAGLKIAKTMMHPPAPGAKTPAEKKYEIEYAQYETDVYLLENKIETYTNWVTEQKDYIDESLYMAIDPYNVCSMTTQYFVKLARAEWEGLPDNASLDPTDSVIDAYVNDLFQNLDWVSIEQKLNVKKDYLMELVSVKPNYDSNSFSIRAIGNEETLVRQLMTLLQEQIQVKYSAADKIGKHTLEITTPDVITIVDKTISERQDKERAALEKYQKELTDAQLDYDSIKEPSQSMSLGFVKWPAAGLVLGIFFGCFWYAMVYLLAGKLHAEKEIKDAFDYYLLGAFGEKKNHDVILKRISENVKNLASDCGSIFVTGNVSEEKLGEIKAAVLSGLPQCHVETQANMAQNVEALTAMASCDGVILVEEIYHSKIKDIIEEQESISVMKKNVIGYVIY